MGWASNGNANQDDNALAGREWFALGAGLSGHPAGGARTIHRDSPTNREMRF